jgi:hypothetical protein
MISIAILPIHRSLWSAITRPKCKTKATPGPARRPLKTKELEMIGEQMRESILIAGSDSRTNGRRSRARFARSGADAHKNLRAERTWMLDYRIAGFFGSAFASAAASFS